MINDTISKPQHLVSLAKEQINAFLCPLLDRLSRRVDPRLMRSFREVFSAILTGYDADNSLLLTRFAETVAPNSDKLIHTVKRFHRFLHNSDWSEGDLRDYVVERSANHIGKGNQDELMIVDLSGCEKKYAKKMEQLCGIRDISDGLEKKKVTRGYPFLLAVLTTLAKGPARLVSWRLFSYRAPDFISQNAIEWEFIESLWARFGKGVIFTMDRGFGRFRLLGQMSEKGMRFVVRLKQDIHVDPGDERLISLKWLSYAMALVNWNKVYDVRDKREKVLRYGWRKVRRPEIKGEVYLVISWLEGEDTPWLLLTNEVVVSAEDAWRIVQIYWRRMEVEQTLRYLMSELGIESFRVRSIEAIKKLFAIVMVVMGMLVEMFEGEPVLVELICRLGRWLGLKKEKPTLYKLRWGLRKLLTNTTPIQLPWTYG